MTEPAEAIRLKRIEEKYSTPSGATEEERREAERIVRGDPPTTERATPSPQAMRAAQQIRNYTSIREAAAIIDRETGVADLADALRECTAAVEECNAIHHGTRLSDRCVHAARAAHAALRKAGL